MSAAPQRGARLFRSHRSGAAPRWRKAVGELRMKVAGSPMTVRRYPATLGGGARESGCCPPESDRLARGSEGDAPPTTLAGDCRTLSRRRMTAFVHSRTASGDSQTAFGIAQTVFAHPQTATVHSGTAFLHPTTASAWPQIAFGHAQALSEEVLTGTNEAQSVAREGVNPQRRGSRVSNQRRI